MTAKTIAIEGSDGIGKATQAKRLVERLKADGLKVAMMSFPCYDTPTGKKILEYLHGKFGDPKQMDPIAAAKFYYEDRKAALPEILRLVKENDFLIFDRYKYSNLYQGAKVNGAERSSVIEKIAEMEKDIPEADIVILLSVPSTIGQSLMEKEKCKDLHEVSADYQKAVAEVYDDMAVKNKNWIKINCMSDGKLLPIEEISNKIYNAVRTFFSL